MAQRNANELIKVQMFKVMKTHVFEWGRCYTDIYIDVWCPILQDI